MRKKAPPVLPKVVKPVSPPRYLEKEGTSCELEMRPAFSHTTIAGYKLSGFSDSVLYRMSDSGLAGPTEVYEGRRASLEGRSGRRDTLEGLPLVKSLKNHGINALDASEDVSHVEVRHLLFALEDLLDSFFVCVLLLLLR
jgi:hypothetical protein